MVLACLRAKGASSGQLNLEPGCQTPLVGRHVALDRTAKRGCLWLQGLAVAVDCVEDGDPGQGKPAANPIRARRGGLRADAALWPRQSPRCVVSMQLDLRWKRRRYRLRALPTSRPADSPVHAARN